MRFAAQPPPPAGWVRDFVIIGDGWNKDGDYNTAFSKTVLPLPFTPSTNTTTPPGGSRTTRSIAAIREDWQKYHTRYVTPDVFDSATAESSAASEATAATARVVLAIVFVGAARSRRSSSSSDPARHGGADRAAMQVAHSARYGFDLEEVSQAAGVDFVHQAPTLDAKLDHIMPQSRRWARRSPSSTSTATAGRISTSTNSGEGSQNRLYRNQGDGTFEDVAGELGVADVNRPGTGVSMGAVWGDYDNDGFEDLFVYKWGRPELFHNDGGKGFTRVTEKAGLPAVGQRQQRDLARLRPRRPARPVHRRLLAGGPRPLASEDDAR